MIVVSNSSPLAALAAIKQTELLRKLYGRVLIPDAVWREVIEQGADKPGVADLIKAEWIECRTGLIPLVKPVLDQLRDEVGFRLSEALYQQVLADEGEAS